MSIWADARGTVENLFQLGIGGLNLRTSSGRLQVRNPDNTALGDLEIAQLQLTAIASPTSFSDQTISRYSVSTTEITATSLTLTAAHNGCQLIFTAATAIAVTIPTGLPSGFNCILVQSGTGQITVSGSGVAVNNYSSQYKTAGQHAAITILQGLTTLIYRVFGETAA